MIYWMDGWKYRMDKNTSKMIRRYSKLRGNGKVEFNYKHLKRVFEGSTEEEQKEYKKEMQNYFEAIEAGEVKLGEPYIYKDINRIANEDSRGKNGN